MEAALSNAAWFTANHEFYSLQIRPRVPQFLKEMSKHFKMYITTMASPDYAKEIYKILDPEMNLFEKQLFTRDSFQAIGGKDKALEALFNRQDNLPFLAIDDKPRVWKKRSREHNLIRVKPYLGSKAAATDEEDVYLENIGNTLKERHSLFLQYHKDLIRMQEEEENKRKKAKEVKQCMEKKVNQRMEKKVNQSTEKEVIQFTERELNQCMEKKVNQGMEKKVNQCMEKKVNQCMEKKVNQSTERELNQSMTTPLDTGDIEVIQSTERDLNQSMTTPLDTGDIEVDDMIVEFEEFLVVE